MPKILYIFSVSHIYFPIFTFERFQFSELNFNSPPTRQWHLMDHPLLSKNYRESPVQYQIHNSNDGGPFNILLCMGMNFVINISLINLFQNVSYTQFIFSLIDNVILWDMSWTNFIFLLHFQEPHLKKSPKYSQS